MTARQIGREACAAKGFWRSNRFLLLRRLVQFSILGLFMAGPIGGVWVLKGNLASSELLGTVPMTDPFVLLQVVAAGHLPETTALIGVALVAGFYLLFGGRLFCSWVCPVNPLTDLAAWLGRRLGVRSLMPLSRNLRYGLLAVVVLLPMALGVVVWELVNPVSQLHRGLIYGFGSGWLLLATLFLFDLFVKPRGWCGHLCPMGATYSLIGRFSPLRVRAVAREACNDCLDCFAVCPEPQVIKPALKGSGSPVILSGQCTNCGRCIDICSVNVFNFGTRHAN